MKILFIQDNINNNKYDKDALIKLNYMVDISDNIKDVYKKIDKINYKFIIIDLEFNNSEKVCINIKKILNNKIVIIGLYNSCYISKKKTNSLYAFNNIIFGPIYNWKKIFCEIELPHNKNNNEWNNWIKKELLYSYRIYNNVFKKCRRKIKI